VKYAHIVKFVTETPWAILDSKLDEIVAILEFHVNGGKFTADELRARLGDSSSRPEAGRRGAVAVLPLHGVIAHRMGGMNEMSGGMSTERFAAMFRQALADDAVTAIVIDVDSPGGTIAGVTELANEIREARGKKPIIAQANALMASAAYWIASAAEEVVATPSAMVGSIGVLAAHVDTSKADENDGITRTVISAGKFKAEGHGPLTDEAKAAIQGRVDDAYAMMVKDISKGRNVDVRAVREGFGEGRVVSAKDALKAGMIDRIATLEETVGRLVGKRHSSGFKAEGVVTTTSAVAVNVSEASDGSEDADRFRRLERF
jgi:signal peptide peptidase SppA